MTKIHEQGLYDLFKEKFALSSLSDAEKSSRKKRSTGMTAQEGL